MSASLIQYGANFKVVGKGDADKLSYRGAFRAVTGSLQDLANHISKGHPWMPALLDRNCKRYQVNANHAEILAVDIDGGLTIQEALAHPLIQGHAGLGIESASSTPEHEKFRLIFRLSSPVTGWEQIRTCNRYLIDLLAVADPACKDASRFFFGAPGRTPFLLDESKFLPPDFLARAIAWHEEQEAEAQHQYQARLANRAKYDRHPDELELVRDALACIPPRQPGSNNYHDCIRVLMALYHSFGEATALELAEQWSPSIRGTTWNIPRKLASFKRQPGRPCTIGTVFYLAQQHGFKFPEFEAQPQHQGSTPIKPSALPPDDRDRYRAETERIQTELTSIRIAPTRERTGEFIDPADAQLPNKPGICLLDGPIKAGKTSKYLRAYTNQHRQQHPNGNRIMFANRNILLRQSGQILGMTHHSDLPDTIDPMSVDLALCPESSGKIALDKIQPHSLVLLDEVETTIQQILEGETCKSYHGFILHHFRAILRTVIERGGWVIGAEDTLTNCSLDFLQGCTRGEVVEFFRFHKVAQPWHYRVLTSASASWQETRSRLEAGENLFIAADTQKYLREVERLAIELGIPPEDIAIVDSNSSGEDWAIAFAKDPDKWIKDHPNNRILGISPSLNYGVSIDDPGRHYHAENFHLVHLAPRDAKQLPPRLRRDDIERYGYVKEHATQEDERFSSARPDVILRDLKRTKAGIQKLTQFAEYAAQHDRDGTLLDQINAIDTELEDPTSNTHFFLNHWAKFRARANHGKANLRANLIKEWERAGHQVTIVEAKRDKASGKERKRIRHTLDIAEAQLFAATDNAAYSLAEARSILDNLNSKPDDRRKAKKALRYHELPGCPLDDPEWVLKVLIRDGGKFLKNAKRLWLRNNPEIATTLDQWNWLGAYQQAGKTGLGVWVPRLPKQSGQADLLHQCPLDPFLDGTITEWDSSTPEAIAVKEWAILHRHPIRRLLGLQCHEDMPAAKIVNKLLRKLGFEIDERKVGPRGGQIRKYRITNLEDETRDQIIKALHQRFLERFLDKECGLSGEDAQELVGATLGVNNPPQSCAYGPSSGPPFPPDPGTNIRDFPLSLPPPRYAAGGS